MHHDLVNIPIASVKQFLCACLLQMSLIESHPQCTLVVKSLGVGARANKQQQWHLLYTQVFVVSTTSFLEIFRTHQQAKVANETHARCT